MQLKKKRSSLAAATLGLLGAAAAPASALELELPSEQLAKKWEFDTGVLVYSESGGRVQAVEPVIKATYLMGQDRAFTVKAVVDSLTGASPNGAAPASTPQTFTGPSGEGTYTAKAGEAPLDDSFKDTRVALSADYVFPVGEASKFSYGVTGSKEFDFLSTGFNARFSHDLNQHNTTLSLGAGYEADRISPVGGTPTALMEVPPPPPPGTEIEKEGESETKSVTDVVFGITQVLDPHSLVQVNYSVSASSGYHTDPYKIVSVVGTDGEPLRYVYESRPDSRTKHALFARYKRFTFGRDVIDASYRYMTDDWGVKSSTLDTTYRWNFGEVSYLEPHLRWYKQTEADFYRAALYDGQETTVAYASADPRLGAFTGYTFGLKYGRELESGNAWHARLEYYQQVGDRAGIPDQAAAGLDKFKLEPDLSAVMFTVGYRFKW